jgi:hypothetical protein
MKQSTFRRNLIWLRICITFFLLAIASLFLLSFTVSSRLTDDMWKQLGLTQAQGTEKIRNSFVNNYLDHYGIRNLKSIATGNRGAVAKILLEYTKKYVNSATFKIDYEKMRSQAKPIESTPRSVTKESIRKDKIEETKKLMKKTEEIIKTADGEMKKTMQGVLDIHKTNMKDYEDPNSKMINMLWQNELNDREKDKARFRDNMKNWETNFPVDYKVIIKSRLQKYLELAETVDFSAELVEKYGKKRFVNPKYEGKNDDWKMIYRAGKDVYEVTRTFAQNWLKEL